ncbi:unnamed protein product, partial [Closterium sp. NIES-53]
VSQVDPVEPVEVAVDSGTARGAGPGGGEPGVAESEGAEPGGAEPERVERGGAEPLGAEPERMEPRGAEPRGAEFGGAEPGGAEPERAESGATGPAAKGASGAGAAGGSAGAGAARAAGPRGAGAGGTGAVGGPASVGAAGGAGAAGPVGARTRGTRATEAGGAKGVGAPGAGAIATVGAGAGGAAGVVAGDPGDEGTGAVCAVSGGAARPRPYYVPLLQQVLGLLPSTSPTPPLQSPPPVQSRSQLQPASPLPGPSPYFGPTRGLTERGEPESRPASPESRLHHPSLVLNHVFELFALVAVFRRVPLPSPLASSLPYGPDPKTDSIRATSPTVARFHATAVIDPSFESTAASALVAELSESASVCPPSVGGECALSTDILEDIQEEFECIATVLPHLVSMVLAPEGDSDAPDVPTLRSYAEAIEGPYSSQWQAAMDAEMASWKSTGTYVDEVPPPGANIVSGMWIFRCSLHEEIWLRRPHGLTGSFPAGTQWSLRRPVYGLRQAPREWHDTLRTTLAALGFAPSTADPSLFLRTDTTLPPFYVFVAQRTITLTQSQMVQQVLQRFSFTYLLPQSTPLPNGHSLSAPPSDESVEPSGPYPELVGCLIHRKEHMDAAKRVLRYLCSTSGMRLVLGGRARVVLTGNADASWVDDLATQRLSQGYTFSLGSGSVSRRSTRSSSALSSLCEAENYAGAMAAHDLRWLTYLLTDLGEAPRSPSVLYIDNKAMLALFQEHRLEHRVKHIALRYFLA